MTANTDASPSDHGRLATFSFLGQRHRADLPWALVERGICLNVHEILRLLPGRRLVVRGAARAEDQRRAPDPGSLIGTEARPVVAKFYCGPTRARDVEAEVAGLRRLADANAAPVPTVLAHGAWDGDTAFLLLAEIPGETINHHLVRGWQPRLFGELVECFARLHAAGIAQHDPHLANFLVAGGSGGTAGNEDAPTPGALVALDGGGVGPLAAHASAGWENLALLLAQPGSLLPAAAIGGLRERYLAARAGAPPCDEAALARLVNGQVAKVLTDYARKSVRDCSEFAVSVTRGRQLCVRREDLADDGALTPLLADPEAAIAGGTPLKHGNTATVTLVRMGGRNLVIKRYNVKGPWHAARLMMRHSRARTSWQNALMLERLAIPTPRPLAAIFGRRGRPAAARVAYFVSDHVAGDGLDSVPVDASLIEQIADLMASLHRFRISHGDHKATNWLRTNTGLTLIDLDAMRRHQDSAAFQRAWASDRRRMLANWASAPDVQAALDGALQARGL